MSIDTSRTHGSKSRSWRCAACTQVVLVSVVCFASCSSSTGSGGATGGTTASASTGGVRGTADTRVDSGGITSGGVTAAAGGVTAAAGGTSSTGGTSATGGSSEPACAPDVSRGTATGATVKDCGACGVLCSLTNANSATCNSGTCTPACSTGFGDCNGSTQNDGMRDKPHDHHRLRQVWPHLLHRGGSDHVVCRCTLRAHLRAKIRRLPLR